jgi:hypothetical protein
MIPGKLCLGGGQGLGGDVNGEGGAAGCRPSEGLRLGFSFCLSALNIRVNRHSPKQCGSGNALAAEVESGKNQMSCT